MDHTEILKKIKESIRIKNNALDNEISDEINACQLELGLAGVDKIDISDPLILETIKMYCKKNHNFEGKGELYEARYEKMKNGLALSKKYGGGKSEG